MSEVSLPTLAALTHLTDREREVVIDLFFVGHTQADVAERLATTKQSVSNTRRRALAKLSAHVKRDA